MQERNGVLEEAPFHGWFQLSYSSYLVLPRSLLEAMPLEWQARMILLLDEMAEVFENRLIERVASPIDHAWSDAAEQKRIEGSE